MVQQFRRQPPASSQPLWRSCLAAARAVPLRSLLAFATLSGAASLLLAAALQRLLLGRSGGHNGGGSSVHDESSDLGRADEEQLHFAWVSDCSGYQEWQSLALLWTIYKFQGPLTAVTRLISGCSPEEQAERRRAHALVFPAAGPGRRGGPELFFTEARVREEALNDTYPPYNRPHSLAQWVDSVALHPSTRVVLLDPDMLMLAPLRLPAAETTSEEVLYRGRLPWPEASRRLSHRAIGQRYRYMGARWRAAGLDLAEICEAGAKGCLDLTEEEVAEFFSVGPPWVVRFSDLRRAAALWRVYTPRVRRQYRQLIAEMYAYVLAFASIGVRHLVVDHFVVSYPNAPEGEHAWPWVEEAVASGADPCASSAAASASASSASASSAAPGRADGGGRRGPTFLHYCEIYHVEAWYFRKRDVPHEEVLSCHAPLFAQPPDNLLQRRLPDQLARTAEGARDEWARREIRQAWFLCTLLSTLNGAVAAARAATCPGGAFNGSHALRAEPGGQFYEALRGFFRDAA